MGIKAISQSTVDFFAGCKVFFKNKKILPVLIIPFPLAEFFRLVAVIADKKRGRKGKQNNKKQY
jgi:hypothetical protein